MHHHLWFLEMVIFICSLSLWYNKYYAEKTYVRLRAYSLLHTDLLLL